MHRLFPAAASGGYSLGVVPSVVALCGLVTAGALVIDCCNLVAKTCLILSRPHGLQLTTL